MIPSPVYWLIVPSKRWTPPDRIAKKRSMILCHSSGSTCSERSIDPFTSAKRTVTCFAADDFQMNETLEAVARALFRNPSGGVWENSSSRNPAELTATKTPSRSQLDPGTSS
jgi:hypothetical protein